MQGTFYQIKRINHGNSKSRNRPDTLDDRFFCCPYFYPEALRMETHPAIASQQGRNH
jgi:hypothetical protein